MVDNDMRAGNEAVRRAAREAGGARGGGAAVRRDAGRAAGYEGADARGAVPGGEAADRAAPGAVPAAEAANRAAQGAADSDDRGPGTAGYTTSGAAYRGYEISAATGQAHPAEPGFTQADGLGYTDQGAPLERYPRAQAVESEVRVGKGDADPNLLGEGRHPGDAGGGGAQRG